MRLTQRAHIVLLAAEGLQNKDIAERLAIGRVQVSRWRDRYAESRIEGIAQDLPRGAPPVKIDVAQLVDLTTQSKPEAATHWSTRKMATELGVSAASVSRHWRANADNYATHKHRRAGMAGEASAIQHALHADLGIVAEYG